MNENVEMKKYIKSLSLTLFPDNNKLECPEPTDDLLKSIEEFGVIYPIIVTESETGFTVIDGRRRIKASRILELKTIKTINYTGLSEEDKAAWALILNDQRSDNVITEFKYYSQLAQNKEWEDLRKEYGFNKGHVQKILSLGKIKELDKLIPAYEKGTVTESTLFAISKLGEERQEYVLNILEVKGKLSLSDVKEAKKINKLEAISSMPKFSAVSNMPTIEEAIPVHFAIALANENTALLYDDLDKAYDIKGKNPGSRLFRLFEV